jgi:DNA-cytosine methyltransferase
VNVLDLFSGIGGFSLGLESTGFFKTIAFVEKDKFCQKVLQKNFPNIPIEDEIRNVKGERFKADVITGGFPCQPFSVAGKRKGTDDDRYLWDETIRIISEQKCKWFIGENVEGIINIQDGLVFRQIHDDLEGEGFEVQSLIIPASGIGAWHQRKRVWIIANSNNNGSYRQKRNETIKSSNQSQEWLFVGDDKDVSNSKHTGLQNKSRRGFRELEKESQRKKEKRNKSTLCFKTSSSNVSNSNSRLRRRRGTIKESGANEIWGFHTPKEEQTEQHIRSKAVGCDALPREDVQNTDSIGLQRHSLQSDNLQKKDTTREIFDTSFKEQQTWWQTQSSLCGVPNGVSYELDKDRTNRIKALGNSIIPQIAREIGKAIMEAELG